MQKYQVRVASGGVSKSQFVRALRLVGSLGLKEAYDLATFLNMHGSAVLIAGVSRDVATHAVETLTEAGARAAVEESSVDIPMMLRPQAALRHRWHWLRGPVPE